MVGFLFLVIKIGILILNKFTALDITLVGGSILWNFGPLLLMVVGGIGSDALKKKYKED